MGQTIEVADVKGKIIEISSISVRLETDEGEVIVPSNLLIKNKVKILK
ncbi:MAG: mechanosensitive ion channel [Microscillaceae bacterium]|nr:mechanosensitive ion channel [Microscillaceae bacterium]